MGTTSAPWLNSGTSEQGASTTDEASSTLITGPITAFAIGAMRENVPNAGIVTGRVASCEHSVTDKILATPERTPSSTKA